MPNADREARRKAIGNLLKLAGKSMGERLDKKRAPAPRPEGEGEEKKKEDDDLSDDDAKALVAMYENPEA
jgi:hypothetical protein